MKKKKNWVIGAVLTSALLALTACSGTDENVATFKDGEIKKEALYQELVASNGEQALNILVRDAIASKEAEKLKVTVTDKEVEEAMSELKANYGTDEAFKEVLVSYNTTEEEVKKDMKTDLLLENVLKKEVKLTDEEKKAYFEKNKDTFDTGEQVKASHILVETEKEAKDLIKKLKDGEDFAELAKKHSTDKGSAVEGGNLDFFGKGQMTEAFEKAAFSLKVNEISEPVESEYGYHIIKVTEKKAGKKLTYENFKEEVEKGLTEEKLAELYPTWLENKFKEYDVKLNINK